MSTPTRGSCYGFEITSDLPLAYLRDPGTSGIPLAIRTDTVPPDHGELLIEWNRERADVLTTRLLEIGKGSFLVRVGDHNSFGVETEPPAILVYPGSMSGIDRETMIWGTPVGASMAHHRRLPVHAGSVEVDGRGIVLAATGSFGKTTLAGAFHAAGHRLLADDMSCAAVDPDPVLYPGPAAIRARPDVVAGFSFEGAQPIAVTPDRTHLSLDADTRGTGDPVPLHAIVFLRISEGPIEMTRATVPDALRDLFGLSFRLPTDAGQAAGFELAAQLAGQIPAWNLARPLSIGSLPAVIETVIETCLG